MTMPIPPDHPVHTHQKFMDTIKYVIAAHHRPFQINCLGSVEYQLLTKSSRDITSRLTTAEFQQRMVTCSLQEEMWSLKVWNFFTQFNLGECPAGGGLHTFREGNQCMRCGSALCNVCQILLIPSPYMQFLLGAMLSSRFMY